MPTSFKNKFRSFYICSPKIRQNNRLVTTRYALSAFHFFNLLGWYVLYSVDEKLFRHTGVLSRQKWPPPGHIVFGYAEFQQFMVPFY